MTDGLARHFVFRRIYSAAADVEEAIEYPASIRELDWHDRRVLACLARYQRATLLHYYIWTVLQVQYSERFRYEEDTYEESAEMRQEVEKELEVYGIDYQPYDQYRMSNGSQGDEDFFFAWFLDQRQQLETLWDRLTEEVFHLLFANRAFLLRFNTEVARWLSSGQVDIPSDMIATTAGLKRQGYFPVWLKKAVFHRDQGKCVLCQRDLTGVFSTDYAVHFDHMVPLTLWGTNDPCNIQLLCQDCNLRKAGGTALTATQYVPWWAY